MRLYLPSAQCFCYVTVSEVEAMQLAIVSEVLAAVHTQLKGDFRLTLRRSPGSGEVRLYGSERISSVVLLIQVGAVLEGWPRLFLRPLD